MLADFVEALIAAFYLSSGLLSASEFMLRLRIIPISGWDITASFLTNSPLNVITKADLLHFPSSDFKISDILQISDKSSVSSILDYQFSNPSLLSQSLTHYTLDQHFNYERLEFLGDAIIDLIILTNI